MGEDERQGKCTTTYCGVWLPHTVIIAFNTSNPGLVS